MIHGVPRVWPRVVSRVPEAAYLVSFVSWLGAALGGWDHKPQPLFDPIRKSLIAILLEERRLSTVATLRDMVPL